LWWLAFATAAASRLLTATIYLGIRLFLAVIGKPFGGSPNFDEYVLARTLGLSGEAFAAGAAAVLVAILWLLLRAVPRGRRTIYLLAMMVGIGIPMLALSAVGSAVLVSI